MKSFLEVFPELHIADSVKGLLELVQVEKVSATRDRSSIRIYIDSPRLMHKQNIYQLEEGIRDQLFPGKKITIKIIEKYHLSSQYTPKKLMDVYRESILMELKNYSILLYNMFRKAELTFSEDGLLTMELEDTMIAQDKAPELKRILEKIFNERCNVPAEIKTTFRQPKKRKEEEYSFGVPAAVSGTRFDAGGSGGNAGVSGGLSQGSYESGSEVPQYMDGSTGADLPFDAGNVVLKPVAAKDAGIKAAEGKAAGGKTAGTKEAGKVSAAGTENGKKSFDGKRKASTAVPLTRKNQTIRMFSTAVILTMRLSRLKISKERLARLLSAARFFPVSRGNCAVEIRCLCLR